MHENKEENENSSKKSQVYSMELHPLFEMAFEAFPNFVIVDQYCRIFYINKCYADLLGIEQTDAIGLPVSDVIPGTRMEEIVHTGQKETGSVITLFDHRIGEEVSLVCNRIPLIQDGKIMGALAMTTFDELSDVKKLYDEIKEMKASNEHYREKISLLEKQINNPDPLNRIIGNSSSITKIKKTIQDFAQSNLPILLTGETGVGKEVFASAIHELSTRRLNPYVKINCAAIPRDLLESELFGYEEGAFTGARKQGKIGKFELADKGTLLLDEIGEMPIDLQSKLLRVLQEKELERVGGTAPKKINVRIICSTNKDLPQLVKEGKFREDLYYRINTIELSIPPLRERMEDLPALCHFFIDKINSESGIHTKGIDDDVLSLFQKYSWPGNVRELEHTMERLAFLNQDSVITLKDCDFIKEKIEDLQTEKKPIQNTDDQKNTKDQDKESQNTDLQSVSDLHHRKEQTEKEAILEALHKTGGNKSQAARLLGIDRSLLYYKIKKYKI